jgi:hypothetical protein
LALVFVKQASGCNPEYAREFDPRWDVKRCVGVLYGQFNQEQKPDKPDQ